METTYTIKPSKRISEIPKYIFAELNEWKDEARAQGIDLIDLGIGNPDGATPRPVVEAALNSKTRESWLPQF